MLLFQTGTVYLLCKVRAKQILILPSLQVYRVHGAAVHNVIPIGSSTTSQNTPFSYSITTKERAAANDHSCGYYMGVCMERQGCFYATVTMWLWWLSSTQAQARSRKLWPYYATYSSLQLAITCSLRQLTSLVPLIRHQMPGPEIICNLSLLFSHRWTLTLLESL